jgi:hypothetical protein
MVTLLKSWRHSGFHVFCGNRIQTGDNEAMVSLARYIIRACFSQERMTYIPEKSKVIYVSKTGKKRKSSRPPYQVRGRPGMAGGHAQSWNWRFFQNSHLSGFLDEDTRLLFAGWIHFYPDSDYPVEMYITQ